MKVLRIFLIAVLLATFGRDADNQESQQKPILIDSFGKPSCEELLERLDFLASEASTDPGSVGFVVMYPGKNVFENVAYERGIINNSRFRRFPDGLIRVIRATPKDDLEFELWRSSADSPLEIRDAAFDYRISKLSRRTRLVEGSLEVIIVEGKLEYGSEGGSCVNQFNLDALSNVLSSNPELSAEIIVFNKSSREGRKLSRWLGVGLAEAKIPKKKMRVFYGGKGVAKEWSKTISAVEVWLRPTKLK